MFEVMADLPLNTLAQRNPKEPLEKEDEQENKKNIMSLGVCVCVVCVKRC